MCLKLTYCAFSLSPFVVFRHYLLIFKPFDEFLPFQKVIANIYVRVARVCVCTSIEQN